MRIEFAAVPDWEGREDEGRGRWAYVVVVRELCGVYAGLLVDVCMRDFMWGLCRGVFCSAGGEGRFLRGDSLLNSLGQNETQGGNEI